MEMKRFAVFIPPHCSFNLSIPWNEILSRNNDCASLSSLTPPPPPPSFGTLLKFEFQVRRTILCPLGPKSPPQILLFVISSRNSARCNLHSFVTKPISFHGKNIEDESSYTSRYNHLDHIRSLESFIYT